MIRKLRSRPMLLAILFMFAVVPAAAAATLVAEDEYVLPAGEVVEGNLYAFGSKVTIKGTVTGDLVAVGQTVEIAPGGVVKKDILAAGQAVMVGGTVEDDFRAAGFTVEVKDKAIVGGDLVAMAYNVSAGEGSLIGGDVIVAGYQGILDGDVGGDVRFAGAGLEIVGSVAGSVEADVGEDTDADVFPMGMMPFPETPPRDVKPGLHVGDDAQIAGDLDVTSPSDPVISESAVGGEITYSAPEIDEDADAAMDEEEERNEVVDWLISAVKNYISLLIFGLLLMWIWPRTVNTAATVLAERKLPSFGWGLVTVAVAIVLTFAIPIVAIMLAVFLGVIQLEPLIKPLLAASGLLWAIVTFGVYLLSWVARIVVTVWIARAILGRTAPNVADNRLALLLLGLLVYVLLTSIPYVGILFSIVFIILGIGAMEAHSWLSWLSRRDAEPATQAGAEPATQADA